jgi:hypothetical protein
VVDPTENWVGCTMPPPLLYFLDRGGGSFSCADGLRLGVGFDWDCLLTYDVAINSATKIMNPIQQMRGPPSASLLRDKMLPMANGTSNSANPPNTTIWILERVLMG